MLVQRRQGPKQLRQQGLHRRGREIGLRRRLDHRDRRGNDGLRLGRSLRRRRGRGRGNELRLRLDRGRRQNVQFAVGLEQGALRIRRERRVELIDSPPAPPESAGLEARGADGSSNAPSTVFFTVTAEAGDDALSGSRLRSCAISDRRSSGVASGNGAGANSSAAGAAACATGSTWGAAASTAAEGDSSSSTLASSAVAAPGLEVESLMGFLAATRDHR